MDLKSPNMYGPASTATDAFLADIHTFQQQLTASVASSATHSKASSRTISR